MECILAMTKENSKEGETPSRRERLVRIPRRQSNYSVLTSRMALRMKDIPGWTSCPPATTSHSIWSMAVTEKEALYSSVVAVSIKVIILHGIVRIWNFYIYKEPVYPSFPASTDKDSCGVYTSISLLFMLMML